MPAPPGSPHSRPGRRRLGPPCAPGSRPVPPPGSGAEAEAPVPAVLSVGPALGPALRLPAVAFVEGATPAAGEVPVPGAVVDDPAGAALFELWDFLARGVETTGPDEGPAEV